MAGLLMTAEVKAVLRDLSYLSSCGVRVAIVQATPEGGVSVGVEGDAAAAADLLAGSYPFPVSCWQFG